MKRQAIVGKNEVWGCQCPSVMARVSSTFRIESRHVTFQSSEQQMEATRPATGVEESEACVLWMYEVARSVASVIGRMSTYVGEVILVGFIPSLDSLWRELNLNRTRVFSSYIYMPGAPRRQASINIYRFIDFSRLTRPVSLRLGPLWFISFYLEPIFTGHHWVFWCSV